MRIRFLFLALLSCCFFQNAFAQSQDNIVEVSGIITTGEGRNLSPVPFVTVAVENSKRGSYANYEGLYSIVVQKGDTLSFTAVGFERVDFPVPSDLEGLRYTVNIRMKATDIDLDEVVIFPWPSREHLKIEFLAMDPGNALRLEDVARKNLEQEKLLAMGEEMRMDGNENADYYLRKQARDFSYQGQVAPQPIFNPVAWSQFFQAWKRGDFRNQQRGDRDENETPPDLLPPPAAVEEEKDED